MRLLYAAIVLLALLSGALSAEVPSPLLQEILIKTTLLRLNDANLTGNYSVLHARLAKPFREQFTPDQLQRAFKSFNDQQVDYGSIAAKPAVPTEAAQIDKRGALLLRGYFDTAPKRVYYQLDFLPSENEWKAIKLNVDIKAPQ